MNQKHALRVEASRILDELEKDAKRFNYLLRNISADWENADACTKQSGVFLCLGGYYHEVITDDEAVQIALKILDAEIEEKAK